MNITDLAVDKLIPYENNPRINDFAVDKVAASIKEFGFKNPIIIDENNIIIAGHTRLKAALQLGLKTVPVLRADDLTEEQIRAFRLADNKTAELSGWDFEKLERELAEIGNIDLTDFGFEFEELDELSIDDIEKDSAEEEKFAVKLIFDSHDDWLKVEEEIRRIIDGAGNMVVGTK